MDEETLAVYDREAAAFATDWHEQPAPTDLQTRVQEFFRPGLTADIGCGSGRDTAWLDESGYPAIGYDASEGLLAEARRHHPRQRFERAALPELAGVDENRYVNVLCETVIMHLEPDAIGPSVHKLVAILEPGGTLYLSWRVTEGSGRRDDQGRLYAAFDASVVAEALSATTVLIDEELVSVSSGNVIHRVIARKAERPEPRLRT